MNRNQPSTCSMPRLVISITDPASLWSRCIRAKRFLQHEHPSAAGWLDLQPSKPRAKSPPGFQHRDLISKFCFQRIGRWRLLPCSNQCGNRFLKPCEIAVVSRRSQSLDREVSLVLQDADRMQTTWRFDAIVHVPRIVGLFRTDRASRRPWPVIAVVKPPTRWIQKVGRLINRQQTMPISFRIAPIDRLRPIESRIASRDEIAVKVSDVAIAIGEDSVV